MAQLFAPISLTFTDQREATLALGAVTFSTWEDVVGQVADLDAPENALFVAQAMTHFSYAGRYSVIEDPAEYCERYKARLDREPKDGPLEPNAIRVSNFGVPDFATIHSPKIEDGLLRYFVFDVALMVPYRVEATPSNPDLEAQVYTLMDLSPV